MRKKHGTISKHSKEENQVPGIPCPNCGVFRIRLSLEQLLYSPTVTCGNCGLSMSIDRSKSTKIMEKLQDVLIAKQNVDMLRNQQL